MALIVLRRRDTERSQYLHIQILDRDQVDGLCIRAIDGEVVNLTVVIAACAGRVTVMAVATAYRKSDSSISQPSGLALNAMKPAALIDDKVVSRVFAEGDMYRVAVFTEREHDRKLRAIADVFGVLHDLILPGPSAGPCPK